MQGKSAFDSSEITYRADELMNAASNRYRITIQVANRAKRRRYEDMDGYEDPLMKPPIRAIIEMSDELNQPEILRDYDEDISKTSYSSDSSFKKSDKLSSNYKDSTNTSHNNANENSDSSNSNKLEQSTSVAREKTGQNKQIEQQINSSNLSSQKIISSQAKIGVSKSTPAQTDQNSSNLNQLKSNSDIDAWNSLTEWVNSSLLSLDLDTAKISAQRLKRNHRKKESYDIARILIIHKAFQVATVDIVRSIPHAEDIISGLTTIDLPTIAKLCAEMVYQIATVYNMDRHLSEQNTEILTIFGLALVGEQAIDAGIGWLKCGNIMGMTLSASAKALMIFAIGNAACVYYEKHYLALYGELNTLRDASQDYLNKITDETAVNDLIEQEIEHSFFIDYSQLEKHLKNCRWKKADRETGIIIRHLCAFIGSDINIYSIENLPVYEIEKIDELWCKYSNEKFGFKIQKQIYEKVGKDLNLFGREINWRGEAGWFNGTFSWCSYYQINFDINSVEGHLPAFWFDIAPGISTPKNKINDSLKILLEREDINF